MNKDVDIEQHSAMTDFEFMAWKTTTTKWNKKREIWTVEGELFIDRSIEVKNGCSVLRFRPHFSLPNVIQWIFVPYRSQINALHWIKSIYHWNCGFRYRIASFVLALKAILVHWLEITVWFNRFGWPFFSLRIWEEEKICTQSPFFRCKNNICLLIFIFIRTRAKDRKQDKNGFYQLKSSPEHKSQTFLISFLFFDSILSKWL